MINEIKNKSSFGMICSILSAVLFGLMPLFTKIAYQYGFNTFTVAFSRFFFGTVIAAVIILFTPGMSFKVDKKQLGLYAILSFFYALTPICCYSAYNYIASGQAVTLHFTYPFFVIFITAIVFRTRLSLKQIICALLCLAGIVLFYRPGSSSGAIGIVLAVASGLFYSIYIVILGKFGSKDVPGFVNIFWIYLFASVEIGSFNLISGNFTLNCPWQGWLSVVGLALVTVVAAVLFLKGIFYAGEVRSSLLSTFEPITSTIIGLFVFQEEISVKIVIGIILILVSAIVIFIPSKKEKLNA